MIHLATLPGVSFGLVEGRPIFLDKPNDRYAALPGHLTVAFAQALARNGQVDPNAPDTSRLLSTGLFELGNAAGHLRALEHRPPSRGIDQGSQPSFHPAAIAEVWWLIAMAGRHLRKTPFARASASCPLQPGQRVEREPRQSIQQSAQRFRQARTFVPLAPSCLADSLALRRWLARRGSGCCLVLGARLEPFAAHCWIEADGVVLNDAPERIASFVPVALIE